MKIYKEVMIKDTTSNELNYKHQQWIYRRDSAQTDLIDAKVFIKELETKLEHLAHDNQLPIKHPEITKKIQNLLTSTINSLESYTRIISVNEETINECEDKIARLAYQINAHTPNNITLNQDHLKSALASDPRTKEVQLYGYRNPDEELPLFRKLSFRMNGVVATLSRPDHHFLEKRFAPTDTVYAALPNLRVHIKHNEVSMLPIRGQGIDLYARGRTCHPHIINATYGEACWGDFGGPIQESLDNKDFHTTVALTTMFLETIDPQDPAGSSSGALIREQINRWIHANLEQWKNLAGDNYLCSAWAPLWITYPDGSCLPINFTPPSPNAHWAEIEHSSDFYQHVVEQCNYYQQNPDELKANNFIAPNQVIKLRGFESDPTFDELFAECEQMQLEEPETA